MTGGKGFVDTNVVLRLINESLPQHAAVRTSLDQLQAQGVELWISSQIIREYLVQVTRPGFLAVPLPSEQALDHVATMRSLFNVADETEAVTDKLLELLKAYPTGGKQVHDANIIATMLVYGIDTLLTINIEDMKRFADRVKLLPLVGEAK